MAKIAKKYLEVHNDKIVERGYHPERHMVSESLFAQSNEYMGARAYFDEGISAAKSLRGVYFNGIYDYSREVLNTGYKGIATRTHFMVNSHDIFALELVINKEKLDLNKVKFKDFYRELSFHSGEYIREFTWQLPTGNVKVRIHRLLSLTNPHLALQKISLSSKSTADVRLTFSTHNKLKQWGGDGYFNDLAIGKEHHFLVSETTFTKQKLYTKNDFKTTLPEKQYKKSALSGVRTRFSFTLMPNEEVIFTRYITNLTSREFPSFKRGLNALYTEARKYIKYDYEYYKAANIKFYAKLNAVSHIDIIGNDEDLQGVRYSIFNLNSTYHGYSPHNNLGAKGLTGEAYSGHAFWDSETYCFAYYLFNNREAAKDLLLFRYNQLAQAKARAKDLDCRGACFPIATLNGEEGCTLWQHASLQQQPTTAVNYALYHYYRVTNDFTFMKEYGLELLKETCLFLLDRGQFDHDNNYFSYYGVMGPDEFKMMVNHNAYTNVLAKFSFDFFLHMLKKLSNDPDFEKVKAKLNIHVDTLRQMKNASQKMFIPYDDETKLFEQNAGFFTLPHIEIDKIPDHEFPLYSNWTYDRIYRGDMIKQPDVLMFLFLFNSHYDESIKRANYDYYEPKTIHESSLSPSIHSIFASELGYNDAALDFFAYASRLDLDDYNNNTNEGLHLTSMAATWMNIVYGFGGFRSDGHLYKLAPTLPARWQGYSFRLSFPNTLLEVKFTTNELVLKVEGEPLKILLYDEEIEIVDTYAKALN